MCSIERRSAVSESECCYAESVGAVAAAAPGRTAGTAADTLADQHQDSHSSICAGEDLLAAEQIKQLQQPAGQYGQC